jgi:hypothetical protein
MYFDANFDAIVDAKSRQKIDILMQKCSFVVFCRWR